MLLCYPLHCKQCVDSEEAQTHTNNAIQRSKKNCYATILHVVLTVCCDCAFPEHTASIGDMAADMKRIQNVVDEHVHNIDAHITKVQGCEGSDYDYECGCHGGCLSCGL